MDILVATRGAAYSDLPLQLAARLAPRLGARLAALTVAREGESMAEVGLALDASRAHLSQLLGGAAVEARLRQGHAAEEILAEVECGAYGLLVVGEHEHPSRLTRLVLGSTSERLIEHAPCPVAVAKGTVAAPLRLLLCDGGAEEAPLIEVLAAQLPGLLQAAERVTVLHVMSQMSAGPGVEPPELAEGRDRRMAEQAPGARILARDASSLARLGIAAELKLRHGLVVDEVLAEAADSEADLVVIGANRGDGWRKVLLGDIAREIFRRLDRPVLVMRPA